MGTSFEIIQPDGEYKAAGRHSLEFINGVVYVTDGNNTTMCDYLIDSAGNIIIDPDGEELPATYLFEEDVIVINNIKYKKS